MKAIITKKVKELYDILNYNKSIEQFVVEAFKNSNIKINEIEYIESHNKKRISDELILLSNKRMFVFVIKEIKRKPCGFYMTYIAEEIKDNDKEYFDKQ